VDEARGCNPRLTEFESRTAVHGKVWLRWGML